MTELELLESKKDYLQALSRTYSATMRVDYLELLSIAYEEFVKAVLAYDPNRGVELNTLIYVYVRNGFIKHVRWLNRTFMEKLTGDAFTYSMFSAEIPDPDSHTVFHNKLNNLSGHARIIAELVLDDNFFDVLGINIDVSPMIIKKVLRKELHKYGWSRKQIRDSFNELKQVFGEG